MRHLLIKLIGYKDTWAPKWPHHRSRPQEVPENWPQDKFEEPILQIEITKAEWDEMFDLYEAHLHGHKNPVIRNAWEQYQMVLRLCGEQHIAGHKQI